MNLFTLLEMAASGFGNRQALGRRGEGPTYSELQRQAAAGGRQVPTDAAAVIFVGQSGTAFVTAFFASNSADVPFSPLNYRLSSTELRRLIARTGHAVVIADPRYAADLGDMSEHVLSTNEWLRVLEEAKPDVGGARIELPVRPTVRLYTSGTTAEPKAAILEHHHLASYIFSSVEFGAADENEAALVSVPPYHIAGVANLLSNLFAGRRIIYLPDFEPSVWLEVVRAEGVTQAMVVPTMLARIVERLDMEGIANTPTLKSISYGGAHIPPSILERALKLFPETGFVHAYGLTETSSTICLLGPEEHRQALKSPEPVGRKRLASVGRAIPGIEIEIRGPDGTVLERNHHGTIWVRGEQVCGRYEGTVSPRDEQGWFPTRDLGYLDDQNYLFVEARSDDTIIRGGENIAPAEIEDVLLRHPAIVDVAVVGIPDEEWGQRIGAVVVPRLAAALSAQDVKEWSRRHLRSSKAVDAVAFRKSLPRTETGKLIRREVLAQILETP